MMKEYQEAYAFSDVTDSQIVPQSIGHVSATRFAVLNHPVIQFSAF